MIETTARAKAGLGRPMKSLVFSSSKLNLTNLMAAFTGIKPKIKNSRLSNLYYTGQLTVPGPGMPPALVSGKIVAKQVMKDNS